MTEVENWISRNLKNYEKRFATLSEQEKKLIFSWLESNERPNVITKISVPQALEKAKRWQNLQEYRKLTEEDKENLFLEKEVVLNNRNFKWVRLGSYQNYLREGTLMQHCVAEYFKSKHSFIYSLRDERNQPHATLELDPTSNQIFQIKGIGNKAVKKDFHSLVKDFIELQYHDKYTTIANFLGPLQDLGNFEHLAYQNHLLSSEEFQSLDRLEDSNIILNNLTIENFPAEVESEVLYLKNIKKLKELTLNAKVKTLIISNCLELEKISFLTAPETLIIDNCLKLTQMPFRLELKKLIINRCPKLKQIAQVLIADECIVMKSMINCLAEQVEVKKLVLFNVKLNSFGANLKISSLLFSHISPQEGSYFKPYFLTHDSVVGKIEIMSYEDLIDYYAYNHNFPEMALSRKYAQEAEGLIKNHLSSNLQRLEELSLILAYPLGLKDLYFRLVSFFKDKFLR